MLHMLSTDLLCYYCHNSIWLNSCSSLQPLICTDATDRCIFVHGCQGSTVSTESWCAPRNLACTWAQIMDHSLCASVAVQGTGNLVMLATVDLWALALMQKSNYCRCCPRLQEVPSFPFPTQICIYKFGWGRYVTLWSNANVAVKTQQMRSQFMTSAPFQCTTTQTAAASKVCEPATTIK